MRKNKKLLLASVAAMGALALGVGATSTFAWFQVEASATMTLTNKAAQIAVSEASTPATLGTFTITPKMGAVTGGPVSLTDTDGNTFVYNTGDTENELPASETTAKYATSALTYGVAYTGDLTDAASINAAWDSYWDEHSNGITFTFADDSAAAYDALSSGDKAGKQKVSETDGKEEMLKLNIDSVSYSGGQSVTVDVSASTLKALTFTYADSTVGNPSDQSLGTLYIAIKGVDGLAQVATTYYHVTGSVALHA